MRLILTALLALMAHGQVTKTVQLTWDDAVNPTGTKYQVYRAIGACDSPNATFAKLGTEVSEKTYTETGVGIGQYCYRVTAIFNGIESPPSNHAGATVPPGTPGNLKILIQIEVKP